MVELILAGENSKIIIIFCPHFFVLLFNSSNSYILKKLLRLTPRVETHFAYIIV